MASIVELGPEGIEMDRDKLLSPDNIEDLVLDGRVPRLVNRSQGKKGTKNYREYSLIFVPPKGVAFGDLYHDVFSGGVEFYHLGKTMGKAEMYEVSMGDRDNIQMRRDKTLGRIGMKGLPVYFGISEKEYFAKIESDKLASKRYDPSVTGY